MKIYFGGILYDMKEGIPITCYNDLVCLKTPGEKHSKDMISLGGIEKKYVVTPDLNDIFN